MIKYKDFTFNIAVRENGNFNMQIRHRDNLVENYQDITEEEVKLTIESICRLKSHC